MSSCGHLGLWTRSPTTARGLASAPSIFFTRVGRTSGMVVLLVAATYIVFDRKLLATNLGVTKFLALRTLDLAPYK